MLNSPVASQTTGAPENESDEQIETVEPVTPSYWDSRRVTAPDTSSVSGIRFATTTDFRPFNYSDQGRLAGFHIDLAELICEQLKIPCTIRAFEWTSIPGAMASRRFDSMIAGLRYTNKTRENYLFSDVYLQLPARFVVKKDGLDPATISPQGLANKKVGVVDGTAHAAFIREYFKDAASVQFENLSGAYDALRVGAIDALFHDGMTLSLWLNESSDARCCQFGGGPYLHPRYFGSGLRIAIRKDRPEIKEAIDFALDRVYGSGRYEELYLRYFPISFF